MAKTDSKDPIGVGLGILRRIGGSRLLDDRNRRRRVERVVEGGTRLGFQTISTVAKRFRPVKKLVKPARPVAVTDGFDRFDLTPTEEQAMFLDSVGRLADEVITPAADLADKEALLSADILQGIHDLGVAMMAAPEELSGAGESRSVITHTLITEAIARGDMGSAIAALSPLAVVNAFCLWGNAEQQARYVPALVGEDFVPAALAVNEDRPLFDVSQLATSAEPTAGGWVLNGEKSLVPLVEQCGLFLVAADTAEHGPQLFSLPADCAGITVQAKPAMGLRSAGMGLLQLKDVKLDAEAMLDAGAFDLEEFQALSRISTAALACGTAQAALDYVIPYIKDRKAFGEPVAHRQSVAFLAANMAIELEGLRLMVWRAASLAEQGKPFARAAYLAQLQAGEYAMQIGTDAVQLLGGHGYTKEHPVERYYRDLRSIAVLQGALLP